MLLNALLFAVGAVVIWFCGGRLPDVGKRLADSLGVSATALGLFVLSVITSLPELAVTLAAMLRENAPDLALGNVLGSNNFNITSLAILELMSAGVFIHGVDSGRYTRTCALLLIMTALTGLGVVFGPFFTSVAASTLIFSLPVVGVFVFDSATHRRGRRMPGLPRTPVGEGELGKSVWSFSLLAAAVVAGGFAIARGANGIAAYEFTLGGEPLVLGQTFVGTLLVAVATSLPEVTVAFGAVRRTRSADIALGTILGSNTVNILVFAIGAPMLAVVSDKSAWSGVSLSNLISVMTALLFTAFVLVVMRRLERAEGVGLAKFVNFLTVPLYLLCLFLVYRA